MAEVEEPYRAPVAQPRVAPMGALTRWVFGFVAVSMMLSVLAGVGLMVGAYFHKNEFGVEDQNMLLAGVITLCAGIGLLYVQVVVAVVWMHKVWKWLPQEQRYAKHWKGWITPGQASLFLLVPYFHWYWMFVVNFGVCDALDRMRTQYKASPAPRNIAMAAMIAQLVQLFVPVPVAGILWLVYMTRVERVMREMSV